MPSLIAFCMVLVGAKAKASLCEQTSFISVVYHTFMLNTIIFPLQTHSLKMMDPFLNFRLATTPRPLMGPNHFRATSPTALVGFLLVGAEVRAARVAEEDEEEATTFVVLVPGKEVDTLLTSVSAPSVMPLTTASATSATLLLLPFFFLDLLEDPDDGSSFSLFSPFAAGTAEDVDGDEVMAAEEEEEEEGRGNPFVAAH